MSQTLKQQLARFPMYYLFFIVYCTVHMLFEFNFWSADNTTVFDKYAVDGDSSHNISIAEQVYYSKATWFFMLVILQALGLRFYTALTLSFMVYSIELLLFFPPQIYSLLNLLLATGMMIEVVVRLKQTQPHSLWN